MRVEDSDGADSNTAMQPVDGQATSTRSLSNPVFTYNPFTGNATARIDFSDPG